MGFLFNNWKFNYFIWKYNYISLFVKLEEYLSNNLTHSLAKVKALAAYGNIDSRLITLQDRPIFQPVDLALLPNHTALRWHRIQ